MSIINSFDNKSKALIDVGAFYKKSRKLTDICIVTFSIHVKRMFLQKFKSQIIGNSSTANGPIDVYLFEVNGKKLLFYLSPIGAATAAAVMHEVAYVSGATKFIVYGSCGVLDSEKCSGKLIVPTASYRDEGLSYHYMPPTDYVDIKNADLVADVFEKLNYPYVKGKSWTTDSIYMETVNKANDRKSDGCVCVEMESSGLQATCNYYAYELYTFFFGADLLNSENWDRGTLGGEDEHDIQKRTFEVAVNLALNL